MRPRRVEQEEVAVGDVIVLRPKTREGEAVVLEHGERWLVREIDRSVLARNLGYLLCPAAYVGTHHLMPRYDRPTCIAQRDGFSKWVHPKDDPDLEVVAP